MLRFALALLLALALSACSSFGGPESGGDISLETEGTIVNQTSVSLLWLALDAESATLVDPAPEVRITDDNREKVLVSGASAPLIVEEYREGEDFVLFLYRVEGDVATWAAFQRVDAGDYEREGTVVIERL